MLIIQLFYDFYRRTCLVNGSQPLSAYIFFKMVNDFLFCADICHLVEEYEDGDECSGLQE